MTKSKNVPLRVLERRLAFLDDILLNYDNKTGKHNFEEGKYHTGIGYVVTEHAALVWALPILAEAAGLEQVVFPMAHVSAPAKLWARSPENEENNKEKQTT